MMDVIAFETERWFAQYEFACEHLLGASDCESITIGELLDLSGQNLDDVRLGYTPSVGSPSLRAAIAAQYESVDPQDVVVLGAPQEGIFLLMHALLESGDDVVVLTPCYDSLCNVPRLVGATVHPWPLAAVSNGWALDVAELTTLVATYRPRLVVVNFPHNPTGFVPSAAELSAVLAIASPYSRVFCDEMYRGLTLDPTFAIPSAVDIRGDAIVLGGLSKAHGLAGLRCGWLVVRDPELRSRIVDWKHYTTICAPAPTEALATAALQVADHLLEPNRRRILRNCELAASAFAELDGFVWRGPRGGSVAFVETPWPDAAQTSRLLAEQHGVVLLPGSVIGGPDFPGPANFVRVGLGREGFSPGLAALRASRL